MNHLTTDSITKSNHTLAELFQKDSTRGLRYVAEGAGLRLDYSKHWLDDNVLAESFTLLDDCNFYGQRQAMFSGLQINLTEQRSVFHAALRARTTDQF